ncbi:MAG: serine hydrolase, partial [Rhodobacteraceae bacterium]|nr:serine hydrolase [Paracoccaceae bacterium]MYF45790.1 D-alanyl-D-alanine carboxypeptidase [Paracoccaceae bacterium]
MDARNGEILHSRSADRILHPASLTKMMTLYVVFEAVENGEISLDTRVKISKRAAAEPPSKLYLRAGSSVRLRYLIRGAAVRSANDASTALAEAIEGSLEAFTRRMNNTAKQMGMKNTHFKNANGLTQKGHYS